MVQYFSGALSPKFMGQFSRRNKYCEADRYFQQTIMAENGPWCCQSTPQSAASMGGIPPSAGATMGGQLGTRPDPVEPTRS